MHVCGGLALVTSAKLFYAGSTSTGLSDHVGNLSWPKQPPRWTHPSLCGWAQWWWFVAGEKSRYGLCLVAGKAVILVKHVSYLSTLNVTTIQVHSYFTLQASDVCRSARRTICCIWHNAAWIWPCQTSHHCYEFSHEERSVSCCQFSRWPNVYEIWHEGSWKLWCRPTYAGCLCWFCWININLCL